MRTQTELPIGIFDSGIGGLTAARQIHRLLPWEDLIYLGDTARVPYGTKSPETVIRFACEDTQFLCEQKVKAVIIACNTASAWALPTLEAKFSLPVWGVIRPGVEAALRKTVNYRIGIVGTSATVRSLAYTRAILARASQCKVFRQACPLLVPLVEEGWIRHPVTRAVLKQYLRPLLRRGIDTLILGCTHYPLLKGPIHAVTGPAVQLVDSAEACARFVRAELAQKGLLRENRRRVGKIQPFVTDETGRFDRLARRFLGAPAEPSRKVGLPFS